MTDRERVEAAISAIRQAEQFCRRCGLPPATAAELRQLFPDAVDAAEALAPGLIDVILGAAAGDPECERKLEAILSCPEPPSPTVQ